MTQTLTYLARDAKVRPNALRREGKIPAVFYGRKQKATSVVLSIKEFDKVWKKAGENAVVLLQGSEGAVEALIHAVDRHPVSGAVRHADFYAFEKGQKLKIKIPIEFIGTSAAVKELGGVLVKVLHELEVEAEPAHLPSRVSVDIAPLAAFGNVIVAKSIALPAGVSLVTNPEEVVASVYEPKEEVVEEAAPDLSTIEVAKKGKEVKEGEEGAEPKEGAATGAKDAKKETPKEAKKEEKK